MDSKYNIIGNKNNNNSQTSFRTSFNTQSGASQSNSSAFNHNNNNNNHNNGKFSPLKRKSFDQNGSNGSRKFRLDRPVTGRTLQEQRRALPVFSVKDQ